MRDGDEQASASVWYRMRTADHPRLDTTGKAEVEHMMRLADFVLIPVRTAFLELDTAARTVQSVHELGKPGAIVLNCAPSPRGARGGVIDQRGEDRAHRLPVARRSGRHRQPVHRRDRARIRGGRIRTAPHQQGRTGNAPSRRLREEDTMARTPLSALTS
jgi:hypothetical protein